MVKRIFIATMIVILSPATISATHYYQSFSSTISGLGDSIENVRNVPIIGKWTNLLPVAVLAASLKKCPIQTMVVLTALGGYLLSENSAVQDMMEQYGFSRNARWRKKSTINKYEDLDESIFVFDGGDDSCGRAMPGIQEDQNKAKPHHAQQLFL